MGILRGKVLGVGTDELHYFVLALAGGTGTCEYYGQGFPVVVLFDFFLYEELEVVAQLLHESSTRRNRIILKILT